MTFRHKLVPLALLLTLAGCGHALTPTSASRNAAVLRAHSRDQATELIAGLAGVASSINTFSSVVTFWEKKGTDIQTSTAEVFTAKPGKIRANITQASSPMKKGVKMVYLGDKQVVVKISFMRKVFAYDDPQVTAAHGWRVDQTDLGALLAGITDPAGTATLVGPVSVNGVNGQAVSVTSPTLLPGVSREVVTLDPTTFLPLRLEAFIGDEAVYRLELSKTQLNPTLPADIFNL